MRILERYIRGNVLCDSTIRVELGPNGVINNSIYTTGKVIDDIVDIIRSVPPDLESADREAQPAYVSATTVSYVPNTAFIMSMGSAHLDSGDVCNTVIEVLCEFGIKAVRADDIEHQDAITKVVLDQIRQSEFLIADLTGERPNVYYEIGYAHALGKRPIMFRKEGTKLHFDLSVHNLPTYKNITGLRSMLRKRLATITGKDSTS